MANARNDRYVSYEDFLAAEEVSAAKHEWFDGLVYDMSGGSIEHARLSANIMRVLANALENTTLYTNLAIYIHETRLATYPDGCGSCEPLEVHRVPGRSNEAIVNPTLIVEVLDEHTWRYDCGEKFAYYMRIPSLREYVLVAHNEPCIEVYRRPERGRWHYDIARAGETVELHGRTIAVDDVYRR